jgi:hypothetical protein
MPTRKRRWDGNSGKVNKWITKGESIRMSIKVPGEDESLCEPSGLGEGKASPLRGRAKIYTPDDTYNYKSRFARYLRGLNLQPAQVLQDGVCTVYRFYSCSSPTKFWDVKVCPEDDATFIETGPALTILCPPDEGFLLNQVTSDGTSFTWEQIAGNRTVFVDPEKDLNPRLFIEGSCFTTGCDDGSFFPVILQVSVDGADPPLTDTLIIYTTPTDTHFGIARTNSVFLPDAAPCREVPRINLAPVYEEKAYCNHGEDEIVITWNLPTCETVSVVGTAITKNTTGQYVVVETFALEEERIFAVQPNVSYRIQSLFNRYGRLSSSLGDPFRITFNNRFFLFGDDTQRGIAGKTINSFTRIVQTIKRIIEEDLHQGIAGVGRNSFAYEPIGFKRIEKSDIERGIAASRMQTSYTRINYGGVVIG